MLTFSGLRWIHWLLLLAGALFLATYLGWVSWAPVQEAVELLGSQPHVREAFQDPGVGRREALFVFLMFLLLTPLAGLVALFLLLLLLAFLAGMLGSFGRKIGLPDWIVTMLLVAVGAGLAYVEREAWLPWSLWVLGFVARAYLVLLQ